MREHWDSIIWERQKVGRLRFGEHLTLEQLVTLSGATPRVVKRLVALDLVDRVWIGGRDMYPTKDLPRVRRILRIRYDLGVSWSSIDLVLRLLDQMEELEQRLEQFENDTGGAP